MRLLLDENAYFQALDAFVASHSSATEFIARFSHLWRCDAASFEGRAAGAPQRGLEPRLYGLLDEVNALCEAYALSLPDGCDYRVSEEQFRKEIQCLDSAIPRPAAARPE